MLYFKVVATNLSLLQVVIEFRCLEDGKMASILKKMWGYLSNGGVF